MSTIQYGNSRTSAYSYSCYGLFLNNFLQDLTVADQFCRLAYRLASGADAKNIRSATFIAIGLGLYHRKSHLRETLPIFQAGYQAGLETGHLEFVGYNGHGFCLHSYWCGQPLAELDPQIRAYRQQLLDLNQLTTANYCSIYWETTLFLLGNPNKFEISFEEERYEEKLVSQSLASNDLYRLCIFYLYRATLRFLLGDIAGASADVDRARQYIAGCAGTTSEAGLYFYDSLIALATPESEAELETQWQRVQENQRKLQHWAEHAPMNYLHKWQLVEAEKYRVARQRAEAIEMYDRAIVAAKENEYIQEEALANELAAKFYLDWGKEKVAQAYMQEAYYCYARWGAKAKIDDLEKRYPQLLAPILQARENRFGISETRLHTINKSSVLHQTFQTTLSSSNSIYEALDFATILKASQTLSSEIQLEKLLAALMCVVMENAGAKKAVLLLLKDGSLAIEAVASFNQDVISISVPLSGSDEVPAAVVNYVKRTWKTVVLDNAAVQKDFIAEPYFMQEKPKSVLCAPMLNQGKLIGLLYLENNLTTGAFTNDRTEVIQLLCAQAAISLENARLYQQSQAYAQELERSLLDLQQAQLQIVQSEKMSTLGNLVTGIAHEINNPVGFISGNIEEATTTIKDLISHLKLYQEKLPNPGEEIEEDAEDIDLEYALEDLPKMLLSMKVGCDRIRGISISLRTFSRADKDYKVCFNIHEGIDSTILILKHRLKANEHHPAIEVVTDYGNLPQIECFPGQLNQVFMNLFANAIDALEESNQGRSFEDLKANPYCITVRTSQSGDRHIKIQIADNGAGMTEAVKQRIFDHLFTTKAVGKGTGLGLAIARQIVVETHGGTIEVNSHQGEGTEFEIVLPVTE